MIRGAVSRGRPIPSSPAILTSSRSTSVFRTLSTVTPRIDSSSARVGLLMATIESVSSAAWDSRGAPPS